MTLTRSDAPLAPKAPATVNYRIDGPAHKLFAHPFPRRVRAEFAGRTVLDTTHGLLLHETALPPMLYVPEADLDASAFVATDLSTHCPFKGDATYRSLVVRDSTGGDRTVENALWAYPTPTAQAPWLEGYASLYWSAADTWFDEDEQVKALTDPYHRVDVRPSSRHVQVYAGDELVAESRHPLVLAETGLPLRFYLSPDEITGKLTATDTSTYCQYKGDARYWTLSTADGRELVDAAWGYDEPFPESSRVAGHVSLLHDDLRTVVDGEPA